MSSLYSRLGCLTRPGARYTQGGEWVLVSGAGNTNHVAREAKGMHTSLVRIITPLLPHDGRTRRFPLAELFIV